MKKKILLTLLVVLLVGVLAASIIACTPSTPNKQDKPKPTPTPEPEDEGGLDLAKDVNDIVSELDKTIQTVAKIENEGSVNATLYVDLDTGAEDAEPLALAINIAASMSDNTKANNWAEITVKNGDEDLFGLAVRSKQGKEETLYIGQPLVSGEYQWVKLSQFEDANLFYGRAISAVRNLLAKAGVTTDEDGNEIENETWTKIENGNFLNSYVSGISSVLMFIPTNLFNVAENATTTKVGNEYVLDLNVSMLSGLVDSLSSFLASLKIPADYQALVKQGVKILLSSNVEFNDDGSIKAITAIKGEAIPVIKISIGSEDGKTTGVGLAYEKDTFKLALGVKDLVLSEKAAAPATIEAEELAIKLSANLNGIAGMQKEANLDVVIQPNVKVGFWAEGDEGVLFGDDDKYSKAGYVNIDFSGLYGYATLNDKLVADYNLSTNGFAIDITEVGKALGLEDGIITDAKYVVPFDAQAMFNDWIESLVIAKAEEDNSEVVPENAAAESQNLVDEIADIVKSFFNENGEFSFNIGSVGTIKGIIEEVVVEKKGEVTGIELDFGKLMAEDGVIGSLIAGSEYLETLKVAEAYNAEGEKVDVLFKDLLAKDKLFDYVLGFINAAIYEAHVAEWAEYEIDNINAFAEFAEDCTIAQDGYTWTTLDDVKALAENIFGIEGEKIDALCSDIYAGTKLSLDLSNAGSAKLSLTVAGKTASIGGGIAFVENVAIADHEATDKMNVEGAIDLTVDNNWKVIANIGLAIINNYLPEKYQVNYLPELVLYTKSGDVIAIYEDRATYNGEDLNNFTKKDDGSYTFMMKRKLHSLYQVEGAWFLSYNDGKEDVIEALLTEEPTALNAIPEVFFGTWSDGEGVFCIINEEGIVDGNETALEMGVDYIIVSETEISLYNGETILTANEDGTITWTDFMGPRR